VDEYESTMLDLLPRLTADKMEVAVALAALPESIRGFGHIKEKAMKAARQERKRLLEEFEAGTVQDAARRIRA
jgi:indolepyruvate ferredoxin oxidoreductase